MFVICQLNKPINNLSLNVFNGKTLLWKGDID